VTGKQEDDGGGRDGRGNVDGAAGGDGEGVGGADAWPEGVLGDSGTDGGTSGGAADVGGDAGGNGASGGGINGDVGGGSGGDGARAMVNTANVAVAELPSVKSLQPPERYDSPAPPVMAMEPPCQPSPYESVQVSVWSPADRQADCE